MNLNTPKVDPHCYYSIKDAAAKLGVDRHTVRRYERLGLIRFTVRGYGRSRLTTGEEITRCWERLYPRL